VGNKRRFQGSNTRARSPGGKQRRRKRGFAARSELREEGSVPFWAEGPEGANEPCNLPDIDAVAQQITDM
jgi:hypothetical protein